MMHPITPDYLKPNEAFCLPVLRRVPDMQNFNGIGCYAVGDDMRQAPLQ